MKLTDEQRNELEEIYATLQLGYERAAIELDLSCRGCPDNCCDSYFMHHTYVEWLYFREGMVQLPAACRNLLEKRAQSYLEEASAARQRGERPQVLCPVNENGLCSLYKYRFLVCRTHGVPAKIKRPDGKILFFPGCFRCQDIVAEKYAVQGTEFAPRVNRTPMLMRLARLEENILYGKRYKMPKIKKTIAEMILQSPEEMFGDEGKR